MQPLIDAKARRGDFVPLHEGLGKGRQGPWRIDAAGADARNRCACCVTAGDYRTSRGCIACGDGSRNIRGIENGTRAGTVDSRYTRT